MMKTYRFLAVIAMAALAVIAIPFLPLPSAMASDQGTSIRGMLVQPDSGSPAKYILWNTEGGVECLSVNKTTGVVTFASGLGSTVFNPGIGLGGAAVIGTIIPQLTLTGGADVLCEVYRADNPAAADTMLRIRDSGGTLVSFYGDGAQTNIGTFSAPRIAATGASGIDLGAAAITGLITLPFTPTGGADIIGSIQASGAAAAADTILQVGDSGLATLFQFFGDGSETITATLTAARGTFTGASGIDLGAAAVTGLITLPFTPTGGADLIGSIQASGAAAAADTVLRIGDSGSPTLIQFFGDGSQTNEGTFSAPRIAATGASGIDLGAAAVTGFIALPFTPTGGADVLGSIQAGADAAAPDTIVRIGDTASATLFQLFGDGAQINAGAFTATTGTFGAAGGVTIGAAGVAGQITAPFASTGGADLACQFTLSDAGAAAPDTILQIGKVGTLNLLSLGGTGVLTTAAGITATTGNVTSTVGNVVAQAANLGAAAVEAQIIPGFTLTGGADIISGVVYAGDAAGADTVFRVVDGGGTLASIFGDGAVTAAAGITATTGNVVATAGAVQANTTVTAGTGLVATTGGVGVVAGDITMTNGSIYHDQDAVLLGVGANPLTTTAGDMFVITGDVGASTITSITGLTGQVIYLTFEDGNTTVVDDDNLIELAGDANFVGTANDCLALIAIDATHFREISRSVN